jgi:hypothetical protein
MATDNTMRVAFRLQTDVFKLVETLSREAGIDPSKFMQDAIEQAVFEHLPKTRQRELTNMKALYAAAQAVARSVDAAGKFDQHFTLTVFRQMMSDKKIRGLYEEVIGVDAYTDGAEKKTPLNMYLGWYIKNAINAEPLLDDADKLRRAFVRNEPIKSYTLLTRG